MMGSGGFFCVQALNGQSAGLCLSTYSTRRCHSHGFGSHGTTQLPPDLLLVIRHCERLRGASGIHGNSDALSEIYFGIDLDTPSVPSA